MNVAKKFGAVGESTAYQRLFHRFSTIPGDGMLDARPVGHYAGDVDGHA